MVPQGPADVRAAGDDLTTGRSTYVVFNPASGRGRGARRLEGYRKLLEERLPEARIGLTTRAGEERELAARALQDGFEVVAAAGGDGTWSNVAHEVAASDRADVAFAMLPNGTGNDFGRNLGFTPARMADAVEALAAGVPRPVDIGLVDTPSASEHEPDRFETRHFLNVVGFGFDIAVIDAAAGARFLKGELLYKVTALQQLFRFEGLPAEVAGAGVTRSGRHLMLTVSNGRYFGGGFPIAPEATVDDGTLHACLIRDASPLTRLRLFNMAERGRHVRAPQVEILEDRDFALTFPEPPRFEVDGDVRQAAEPTVRLRVRPGALRVLAPADSPVR